MKNTRSPKASSEKKLKNDIFKKTSVYENEEAEYGNIFNLAELQKYSYNISGKLGVVEHRDKERLTAVKGYKPIGDMYIRKSLDVELEQGCVELGFSDNEKKIIMAVKKRAVKEQTPAYENERIANEIRNSCIEKNIVSENEKSAFGIKFDKKLTSQKLEYTMAKINNKKINTTSERVLPFFNNKNEKKQLRLLLENDRKLKAHNSLAGQENRSVIEEKAYVNRQINIINSIISKKSQKKIQFTNIITKSGKILENIKTNTMDELLYIIKKRNSEDEPADEPVAEDRRLKCILAKDVQK